jgi:hypothetical protein
MARKHRTRRQRRTQKRRTRRTQRGGDVVTNIGDWVDRVSKHRAGMMEKKGYVFDELKDEALAIPVRKKTEQGDSEIEQPFELLIESLSNPDLRVIGRALRTSMDPIFDQVPSSRFTSENFATMIATIITPEHIADYAELLTTFTVTEQALRKLSSGNSGTFVSIDSAGEDTYPLYIWYLIMNMPPVDDEGSDMAPILGEESAPIQAPQVPAATTE